ASRFSRRSDVHLSQEPGDVVHRSDQRHQSRELSPERLRREHAHPASEQSDRKRVSLVAGCGSVDRILIYLVGTRCFSSSNQLITTWICGAIGLPSGPTLTCMPRIRPSAIVS